MQNICTRKEPEPTMSNPPTPRRCRRILEAHHLDCQGCSPDEIATQLRCARSTVYAYFRDFQLHRAHILRTVAADRLADQVRILTTPETDPDQHRQTVAATRELRLLLQSLPAIHEDEDRRREQELAAAAEEEARTRALEFETSVPTDTNATSTNSTPESACSTAPSASPSSVNARPKNRTDAESPSPNRINPHQTRTNPHSSRQIWTNPDKKTTNIPSTTGKPHQPHNWPRLAPPQHPYTSVVIPLPDLSKY